MSALLVERKLAISTMVCDQGPKSVEIFRELKKTNILLGRWTGTPSKFKC